MSDASPREWRFYLGDMIAFCERVLEYTHGMNRATFAADRLRYDATLRNLEMVGEAATHIPDAVRAAQPNIPWRKVVATRNRLIHAYLGIDATVSFCNETHEITDVLEQVIKLPPGP